MQDFKEEKLKAFEGNYGHFLRTLEIEGDGNEWLQAMKAFLSTTIDEALEAGYEEGKTDWKRIGEGREQHAEEVWKGVAHEAINGLSAYREQLEKRVRAWKLPDYANQGDYLAGFEAARLLILALLDPEQSNSKPGT